MKSLLKTLLMAGLSGVMSGDEPSFGSGAVVLDSVLASEFEEGIEIEIREGKLTIDDNEVELTHALRTIEQADLSSLVIFLPTKLEWSDASQIFRAANGKSRYYLVSGSNEALVLSDSNARSHSQLEVQIDAGKLAIDGFDITKKALLKRFDSPGKGVVSLSVTWSSLRDQEAAGALIALLRDLNAVESSGRRRWLYCLSFVQSA